MGKVEEVGESDEGYCECREEGVAEKRLEEEPAVEMELYGSESWVGPEEEAGKDGGGWMRAVAALLDPRRRPVREAEVGGGCAGLGG